MPLSRHALCVVVGVGLCYSVAMPAPAQAPRLRKNWRSLSAAERQAFVDACLALKENRLGGNAANDNTQRNYDYFVLKHFKAFDYTTPVGEQQRNSIPNPAHQAPAFLPWHREYLLEFEDALRTVAGGRFADVTVPYWDWAEEGLCPCQRWPSFLGPYIDPRTGKPVDGDVRDGPFRAGPWSTLRDNRSPPTRGNLRRKLGKLDDLPNQADVTIALLRPVYDAQGTARLYGPPTARESDHGWNTTSPVQTSFRNALEGWLAWPMPLPNVPPLPPEVRDRVHASNRLHNHMHVWIGGDMASSLGPNDPVFWLHHSQIDRLFCKWQDMHLNVEHHLPIGANAAERASPGHNAFDTLGLATFGDLDGRVVNRRGVVPRPFDLVNMRALGYRYDDCTGPPTGACCFIGPPHRIDLNLTQSQCIMLNRRAQTSPGGDPNRTYHVYLGDGTTADDDCNTNCVRDSLDISNGRPDINSNGIPDECEVDCNTNLQPDDVDITTGASQDCDSNGVPDECEDDCNTNGFRDDCDLLAGRSADCNSNGVPDECDPDCNTNNSPDDCDIAGGLTDCDGNGLLDICGFTDCNTNHTPDACDVAMGEPDCNFDFVPDECQLLQADGDCNTNGLLDICEAFLGLAEDCDFSGVPDACELASGFASDCNSNGVIDACDGDCNTNGLADECDIAEGRSEDCNGDGIPSECHAHFFHPDCNTNGEHDECETADGHTPDCNSDSIPDSCQLPDDDCNSNGTLDQCEISSGALPDCDGNGIPNACDTCGDINHDALVDGVDFGLLLSAFGGFFGDVIFNAESDLDYDGQVTFVDYQRWLCCYRAFGGGDPFGPPPVPANAGDMNLDGQFDGQDIQGFVQVLLDPTNAPFIARLLAEMSGDGWVDTTDVHLFVERLTQ